MMKDILIIGAGGVGREVALMIEEINNVRPTWNLLGFIDDNEGVWGMKYHEKRVLGGLESLILFGRDVYVVIAISNGKIKRKIAESLQGRCRFATIISPKVRLHDFMTVGEGTIIYEGSVLTTDIKIGKHVLISPKCGIGHDSIISDYSSLLWNVNISGRDLIEEEVLIGSAATVLQNLTVGRNSTLGAGTVVTKDIPSYSTAVGIPASIIKREDNHGENTVCNNG